MALTYSGNHPVTGGFKTTRLERSFRGDQQPRIQHVDGYGCVTIHKDTLSVAMNSLGPSQYKDELVVDGCCVVWTTNEGLIHKRTFNFESDGQPITQALFTVFSSSPTAAPQTRSPERSDLSPSLGSTTANKALVVVLKTIMHIIYVDGGSYIVHLPFPVYKIWSIPLGILLERQLDSTHTPSSPTDHSFIISESKHQLPRIFTLSSPLEDFGMVSCNRSSLDPNEEIIFFSSQDDALCVTRNGVESRITLWHATPDQQARKKVRFNYDSINNSRIDYCAVVLRWAPIHSSRTKMKIYLYP